MPMVAQGLFGMRHKKAAAAVGHLFVPEKARRLDVPVFETTAGILETRRQACRDTGVQHHALGDHVMEAQGPQPAQIGRPT